jgi:phage regulator Rha-like protein
MEIIKSIQNRIYEIREERIMLDFDIAELYEIVSKVLNQAVKRNIRRFPSDFMFQLSSAEWSLMRSQFAGASAEFSLRSQIVTLNGRGRHSKYLPYAFTEQGIAMLSGILNSEKAIQMNIAIMRAFVEARRLSLQEMDLRTQLKEIKEVLGVHDSQLNQIYDAMENLLDEKAAQRRWNDRERIGFKN